MLKNKIERRFTRRQAMKAVLAAAGASFAAAPALTQTSSRKWSLRYAPELDWVPEMSFAEKLGLYAEYGFTATEYNWLLKHPLGEVEQLRKELDKHHIQLANFVAAVDGVPRNRVQIVDPKTHDDYLKLMKQVIEYHKVAGNSFVVTDAGRYAGGSRSDNHRALISVFKRVADLLEPTQLTAVIEPLSNPLAFFYTAGEIAEVVAEVGSPHVRMLFDLYHLQVTEGNLMQHMEDYWPYIAYIQTGDVPGRKEPGTGEVNYKNVFRKLAEKKYTGIVGMEHQLSTLSRAGIIRCFEMYRDVDA